MIDYLPAYAPDMNPVECIWGYLKHHAMPNYCARDLGDLAYRARSNLAIHASSYDPRAGLLEAG